MCAGDTRPPEIHVRWSWCYVHHCSLVIYCSLAAEYKLRPSVFSSSWTGALGTCYTYVSILLFVTVLSIGLVQSAPVAACKMSTSICRRRYAVHTRCSSHHLQVTLCMGCHPRDIVSVSVPVPVTATLNQLLPVSARFNSPSWFNQLVVTFRLLTARITLLSW